MIEYKSLSRKLAIVIKDGDAAFHKAKISQSKDAYEYAKRFYNDDLMIYESFFVILTNTAHNTIGWYLLSQGGIAGTVADPRLIAKFAIESLASAVVLIHNHPSGNPNPSEADKRLYTKIKEGLALFDIVVLDSIIITEDSYYSFADEGIL